MGGCLSAVTGGCLVGFVPHAALGIPRRQDDANLKDNRMYVAGVHSHRVADHVEEPGDLFLSIVKVGGNPYAGWAEAQVVTRVAERLEG